MMKPLQVTDLGRLLTGAKVDSVCFTTSSVDMSFVNESPTKTSASSARIEIFSEIQVLTPETQGPLSVLVDSKIESADFLIAEIGETITDVPMVEEGIKFLMNNNSQIIVFFQNEAAESLNFYATVNGHNRTLFV